MRAFSLALLAASGTALVTASALPASAQLARPQTVIGVTGGNDFVTEVRWRRGWRGGYGYRGRYYGPGIGLGIGLATGALIGGALAAPYYGNSYEPGYAAAYSYAPGPTQYYRGDPSSYYAPYYDGGAYNRERALTGSDW